MRSISTLALLCCFVASVATAALADPLIPGSDKITTTTHTYKTIGDVKLELQCFYPADHKPTDKRPAIIFYFGGGWTGGTPKQFEQQATYFATRGMVAITADYRVKSRQNVTPDKCVMDAKSGVRWVRAHAAELGIDPDRIVAAGGSAGGHIAACTGTVPGYEEESEDKKISSVPNAMVLFNPVLNTTTQGWPGKDHGAGLVARFGEHGEALSPLHQVKKGNPPTLVIHGKGDTTVPYAHAEAFAQAMDKAGNRCELAGYEGQPHGFFNYGRGENKMFLATTLEADKFLVSLKYLEGPATLGK